jgi:hypothetical protein
MSQGSVRNHDFAEKIKVGRLFLALLVTVLSQPFFAFVRSDLMTFSFFTTRHGQSV